MRNQKTKQPNAQKHGVFAQMAILPGEDPKEFEKLHSDLTEEWAPVGAIEEDAVLRIAKAVWRKRRVQNFLAIQMLGNSCNPMHPSYSEIRGLGAFVAFMTTEPEVAFEEYAKRTLRTDKIDYLKQKFPRSNFESASEWVQAVIDEIHSVLIPNSPDIQGGDLVALARSAATFSDDVFNQELALDERLDAMIDRAVKRLIQIKVTTPMLAQTSTERVEVQPRAIAARKTSGERRN
jgi:hypothetical protein